MRCCSCSDSGCSRAAAAHAWGDALETLLCLAATPALRRTGVGSAPAVWNLLDNARFNYERDALRATRLAAAAEQTQEPVLAASADAAPHGDEPGDVWGRFHALAAQRAAALTERGVLPDDEL